MRTAFFRFLSRSGKFLLRISPVLLVVLILMAAGVAGAVAPGSGDPGGVLSGGGATPSAEGGGTPAKTLGDVLCNVAASSSPFGSVFNWFAIVAGIYFAYQGIVHLKGRAENPSQFPLQKAMAYLVVASALLSLPYFEGMLVKSLTASQASAGGVTTCTPGGVKTGDGASSASATPDVMLTNLMNDIKVPMQYLLSVTAELMGIYLIVRGLMKATKHGTDPKMHSLTNIYTSFVIGAVLCVVGSSMGQIVESIFGGTTSIAQSSALLQWTAFKGLPTQATTAITAALTFFQLVGAISFIRGWTILRQAVEGHGQHTLSQGLTHIIGGVIAFNIFGFIPLLDKTFGTNITGS